MNEKKPSILSTDLKRKKQKNRDYLFRNKDWISETLANTNTIVNTLGKIEMKKLIKIRGKWKKRFLKNNNLKVTNIIDRQRKSKTEDPTNINSSPRHAGRLTEKREKY